MVFSKYLKPGPQHEGFHHFSSNPIICRETDIGVLVKRNGQEGHVQFLLFEEGRYGFYIDASFYSCSFHMNGRLILKFFLDIKWEPASGWTIRKELSEYTPSSVFPNVIKSGDELDLDKDEKESAVDFIIAGVDEFYRTRKPEDRVPCPKRDMLRELVKLMKILELYD